MQGIIVAVFSSVSPSQRAQKSQNSLTFDRGWLFIALMNLYNANYVVDNMIEMNNRRRIRSCANLNYLFLWVRPSQNNANFVCNTLETAKIRVCKIWLYSMSSSTIRHFENRLGESPEDEVASPNMPFITCGVLHIREYPRNFLSNRANQRESEGASHCAKDSGNFSRNSNGKIRFGFFWPEYSGWPLEVVHIFRSEYSDWNLPFHFWQAGSLP